MVGLATSTLQSVGISEARGAQLVSLREQNAAALDWATGNHPDTTDRGSGTGSGGVAADKLGFSRELTPAQRKQVGELRRIDAQVREHEMAHLSAGRGVVTSGANYSFTYGPDGKSYAVAGEVGIDTSPASKPEATIDKGRAIQAAALAPRDPSPQDYRVASVGGRLESQGRRDLAEQQALERAEAAAKSRAQREGLQEQNTARDDAVAVQAQRVGEAQNVEPTPPASRENDLARQRIAASYQTVPKAVTGTLSLFA